ncbi:hypothetical protein [Paenibacillus tianjinensis]|uniref:Uncharacterized protein n=1 Tax=Paenibacillus tianjinensis TaxID=2810347 RepID=A0ABX7LIT0_9BACL|nr:hypothetical protein [Paenibacillus tianjinensis]QSF48024.1 hypothetical protein JRJ22_26855 [Paenibacillus tianjinensis]
MDFYREDRFEIRKSKPNSGRKSKHSPQLRATPGIGLNEQEARSELMVIITQCPTSGPAQHFIMKGEVIPLIDSNVKQDLREIGKKLTNLRGSL